MRVKSVHALPSLVRLCTVTPFAKREMIITLVSQSKINWSVEVARTESSSDHANVPTGKGCSLRVNSTTHSREEDSASDYECGVSIHLP